MVDVTHTYTLKFDILDLSKEEIIEIWSYMKNHEPFYNTNKSILEFKYFNGDLVGIISLSGVQSLSKDVEESLNKMREYMEKELAQYAKFKRYQSMANKFSKNDEKLNEIVNLSQKYERFKSEISSLNAGLAVHRDLISKIHDDMHTTSIGLEDITKCVEKIKKKISKSHNVFNTN